MAISDADVDVLPGLLGKITKYILSINNDEPVKYLRGGVKLTKDLYLSYSDGITGIVNSLSKKKTYYRHAKTFIAILKYSLIAIQRFCQRYA